MTGYTDFRNQNRRSFLRMRGRHVIYADEFNLYGIIIIEWKKTVAGREPVEAGGRWSVGGREAREGRRVEREDGMGMNEAFTA